jgi:hypothetical protein
MSTPRRFVAKEEDPRPPRELEDVRDPRHEARGLGVSDELAPLVVARGQEDENVHVLGRPGPRDEGNGDPADEDIPEPELLEPAGDVGDGPPEAGFQTSHVRWSRS